MTNHDDLVRKLGEIDARIREIENRLGICIQTSQNVTSEDHAFQLPDDLRSLWFSISGREWMRPGEQRDARSDINVYGESTVKEAMEQVRGRGKKVGWPYISKVAASLAQDRDGTEGWMDVIEDAF